MCSVCSVVIRPSRPGFDPPGIFQKALILAGYVASSRAKVSGALEGGGSVAPWSSSQRGKAGHRS
jgi:hypothetical protein